MHNKKNIVLVVKMICIIVKNLLKVHPFHVTYKIGINVIVSLTKLTLQYSPRFFLQQ